MTTTKPQSTTEETWRSDKAREAICDAAERIANQYCSEDDTYDLEVRRLRVAIINAVDQRVSPRAAPVVDKRVADNLRAIIIRCEDGDKRSDWLPIIARLAREALNVFESLPAAATAAPVEQSDMISDCEPENEQ